jgi:IclR family transcriptional regulator, KDG regulon repressor
MTTFKEVPPREGGYQVRALERGLDILEVFTPQSTSLTLSEIANRAGLPKSTVKRLVSILGDRDFLEYSPETERYRIGIKNFELGNIYIQSTSLEQEAHPILEWLSHECNQTSNLGLLHRGQVVHLDVVEPDRAIRYFARVGERDSVHCTGLGKVLISEIPEEQLSDIFLHHPLISRTTKTITNTSVLSSALEVIRKCGFALDDEESTIGLRCVAAPVRDSKGAIIAAISVSGPTLELIEDNLERTISKVKEAAMMLSSRMGYLIQIEEAVVE